MCFPTALLATCLFCTLTAFAVTPEEIIAEMEKIQGEYGIKSASIGLCFIPVDGEPSDAVGYQPDLGLIPASTMKVVTTATANEILGPDFRFKTELQTAGKLDEEGTLTGHLIIRGGGDPTLGSSNLSSILSKWQAALREAGIKKIEGSIVGDATIFDNQLIPDTWQYNDFGNYYGAGACGLTFHQNLFYCSFRPGNVGAEARFVGTDPELPEIQFINEMRTGTSGSGDRGYIYGLPYAKTFYLRGTVPGGRSTFTIKGALPDPAFFCAEAFTKHLNNNGLEVSGEPTTVRLMTIAGESVAARKIIHTQKSDTLASIMNLTNMKSNNLRAECMHRMLAAGKESKASTVNASKIMSQHWSEKGVDMTGSFLGDGCGLSRSNIISTRQMALILYHAAQHEDFDSFYKTLPVAGRSGTLSSIGGGSAAEGRVVAKSGTIARVRNYAGYVNTRSGERYAFAIFFNNYSSDLWSVKSKIVRVWSRMVGL